MVAQTYSEHRRQVAQTLGLGRKKAIEAAVPVVEATKKSGRKAVEVAAPVVQSVAEPVKKVARKARKGVTEALKAAKEHLPG